jgi:hypothetical protein
MVAHVAGKPHIGSIVHFYNPKLLTGVGMGQGHEGRGEGPYAALVTNNIHAGLTIAIFFPDIIFHARGIPHKDDPNTSQSNGYWDWKSPADGARAAKELAAKAAEDKAKADASSSE